MNTEKFTVLVALYRYDVWSEELIDGCGEFGFVFRCVLTKNERQLVESKVEGKTNDEIAYLLGVQDSTVKTYLQEIKGIYKRGYRKFNDTVNKARRISRAFRARMKRRVKR